MFPVPAWLILAQALPSKNLQMQLCEREGTGKKMSQGRRETAGLDIGEDGPSPQNPEAVCILMLMLSRPPPGLQLAGHGSSWDPGSGPFLAASVTSPG